MRRKIGETNWKKFDSASLAAKYFEFDSSQLCKWAEKKLNSENYDVEYVE